MVAPNAKARRWMPYPNMDTCVTGFVAQRPQVVVGGERRVRKVTDQTLESLSRPDPQLLQTMSGSVAGK